MLDEDKNLLLEFKQRLPIDIKKHLKQLIAFGSSARGDASSDSDLDVVALIDEKDLSIEKKMYNIAYQVMWDHNFNPIISLKVFNDSKFKDAFQKGFIFYKHVMRDGIQI